MGTFCYDQYEHPLLWCDEKKKFVERKNADESMMQWRQKKIQEKTRNEKDKLEYQDLSVKHCPWGRPGGGAPNVDVRRHDITVEGLHSTPGTRIIPGLRSYPVSRRTSIPRGHYLSSTEQTPSNIGSGQKRISSISGIGPTSPYSTTNLGNISITRELSGGAGGSGGNRADTSDIRSAAERLFITLKDQPSFKNKAHVDIELRYKTTAKGNKLLDKIVVTEMDNCPGRKSVKKSSKENPWGKPGPGGKPWRNQKTVGNSLLHTMGWTSEKMLRDMDDTKNNGLRSKSTEITKSKLKKNSRSEGVLKNCCDLCVCKCKSKAERSKVAISSSAGMKEETKADLQRQIQRELDAEKDKIDVTTVNQKTPKVCPRYEGTLTTPTTSNVELVPLLARRRGMNRPISLSSTDVTKRTVENSTPFTVGMDMSRHLNEQVIEKRQHRTLNKLKERQACSDHFQTLDTYWGRPGYGAPKAVVTKLNLNELLWSGGE